MTTNNQQGMTDETIRERLIWWVTDYKDAAERHALAETPHESAVYLLSLISQHSASQEAEIKRLKELNASMNELAAEMVRVAESDCADEIIRILNDSDIYYTKLVQIAAYAESLKKRVRGDGT